MTGRRAWITGGGSGIGRALALELAAAGWQVAISARSASALDAIAGPSGGRILAFPLDVCDPAAQLATLAAIEAQIGPLDLAILNAGTHHPMGLADFTAETAQRLMAVNYFGVVHGLAALLPRMGARRAGQIALVASVAGYRGLPSAAAYGPTKAALINLAESLRPEAVRAGIDLRLINPGFVATPLTDRNDFPMPDCISAEDAARAIRQGLAGSAFEIAFPWRFSRVMKLLRILPDRLFFALTTRMLR